MKLDSLVNPRRQSFVDLNPGLVARLYKDRDRSDREDEREDYATVAIDFLGPFRLLIVIQDCCHQNLNQGEENK